MRFMIYLVETGICLSLLYLAYWLFLRRETYFSFIRIFLVGSILLSLLVPLLHLNFAVPQGNTLVETVLGIERFRSGYEEVIRMLNADFGDEPGVRHAAEGTNQGILASEEGGIMPSEDAHGAISGGILSGILIIIYICGVIYFSARFIYLVIRLFLLAKRNRVTRQAGFRLVEMEEKISPFSFFRFLFINRGSLTGPELHQVLEHEKAHIRQRHTLDHLFAHGLAVFQWFNPVAWQLRNALKTTHEYIADRQVMNRGIERFDYQSLLLSQVIGYHSTELVNNFNLKPIKKRIAMMNRKKSGTPAKLKAILVLPFTMIIFLLFTDFTLKGTENSLLLPGNPLAGLWINQGKDDFSKTLFIKQNKFTYTDGMEIREYFMRTEAGSMTLSEAEGVKGISFRYELRNDELIFWWNDTQKSRYRRSDADNTLDHYLTSQDLTMTADLPHISQYRLMNEDMVYRICYGKDPGGGNTLTFNGKSFTLVDLKELVQEQQGRLNKLDQRSMTALFLVDRDIPMILVDQVRNELRKMGALHIAEGGYPHGDLNLSPLLYHAVALPRLLPPPEAMKLEKEAIRKKGGRIHTIDLAARNTTPRDVDLGLQEFIRNSPDNKYVISLEYDGAIPYGVYVEAVDMVFQVVYGFRDGLAMEKYGLPYAQLSDELQRKMRKAYPMAMSETLK